jgi:hypothetical protein
VPLVINAWAVIFAPAGLRLHFRPLVATFGRYALVLIIVSRMWGSVGAPIAGRRISLRCALAFEFSRVDVVVGVATLQFLVLHDKSVAIYAGLQSAAASNAVAPEGLG